jgi:hypothetical protein
LGRWLSRDSLGEYAFFMQYTKSLSRRARKEVARRLSNSTYLFVDNNAIDIIDRLGLSTITKAMGNAAFGAPLEARLKKLCESPCKPCCSVKKCKKKATKMAQSIKNTWSNAFGVGTNTTDDNVGGWLCWDWQAGFMRAAFKNKPRCFRLTRRGVEQNLGNGSIGYHFYLEIKAPSTPEVDQCKVYIDDGWFDLSTFVHDAPWLPSSDWAKSSFDPAGRLQTPGIVAR